MSQQFNEVFETSCSENIDIDNIFWDDDMLLISLGTNEICRRCQKPISQDQNVKTLDCLCNINDKKPFYHEICLRLLQDETRLQNIPFICPECMSNIQYTYESE